MNNFIDVLIEESKKKIERVTGEKCDYAAAWEELHQIFKDAKINKQNKFKILNGYAKNPNYRISRGNAIALGIAFGFQLEEMNTFLSKAGYFLSDCHQPDKIIIDLISTKKCSLQNLNETLYHNGFALLIS